MVLDTECTNNRSRTVDEDQCGVSAQGEKAEVWSQDELAIASGLNLRTIQRIESEASASLQSKKALASALDLDVQDLDYRKNLCHKNGNTKWSKPKIEQHSNQN